MFEGQYCVIRTHHAGVHAGIVVQHDPATNWVTLREGRRLWFWRGAFTLSAVAQEGISPESQISLTVAEYAVGGAIEILPCTPTAESVIRGLLWHHG